MSEVADRLVRIANYIPREVELGLPVFYESRANDFGAPLHWFPHEFKWALWPATGRVLKCQRSPYKSAQVELKLHHQRTWRVAHTKANQPNRKAATSTIHSWKSTSITDISAASHSLIVRAPRLRGTVPIVPSPKRSCSDVYTSPAVQQILAPGSVVLEFRNRTATVLWRQRLCNRRCACKQ